MRGPNVSIVVTTRNSSRTLEVCLKSLLTQTHKNIEIIIVDNYSADDTRHIAEKFGRVFLKGNERSSQRNYGASMAVGDCLLFLDADMELEDSVISECVTMARNGFDATVISEVFAGSSFWAKCRALERSCYELGGINWMVEAARFFSRRTFLELGGYDERFTGIEDWDLGSKRIMGRYKVSKTNSRIIHHEQGSLGEYVRRAFYYAKNSSLYFDLHHAETSQHIFLSRIAYFQNWRKLAKEPNYGVGMLFLKFCEYSAAAAGYLRSKFFT